MIKSIVTSLDLEKTHDVASEFAVSIAVALQDEC